MANGVLKECKPIRLEGTKLTRDFNNHARGPRPVKGVRAVIQAATVVEMGEKPDHSFVSSGFFGECEAGILDPLPMVGTVDCV